MSRIWPARGVTVWQPLPQKHWSHPLTVSSGLHSPPESLPVATLWACGAIRMCVSQPMMRVSEPMLDMDMGNYSEVLDPTYTTLEFDTMQILYNSNGEFMYSICKRNQPQRRRKWRSLRGWLSLTAGEFKRCSCCHSCVLWEVEQLVFVLQSYLRTLYRPVGVRSIVSRDILFAVHHSSK